jgi:nicotinamide riboside transporter PnuC
MSVNKLASPDLWSWLCSLTSILSVYFTPKKRLLGPIFGMIGFVPWTALSMVTGQWGLMPVTVIITVLQIRTFLLWRGNERRCGGR